MCEIFQKTAALSVEPFPCNPNVNAVLTDWIQEHQQKNSVKVNAKINNS